MVLGTSTPVAYCKTEQFIWHIDAVWLNIKLASHIVKLLALVLTVLFTIGSNTQASIYWWKKELVAHLHAEELEGSTPEAYFNTEQFAWQK